jgi:hypothetical protein
MFEELSIAELRLAYKFHILKMPPDKESYAYSLWFQRYTDLRSWMLIRSERSQERPEPKPEGL